MLRLYRLRPSRRAQKRIQQVPESPAITPQIPQVDPITEALGSSVLNAIQEGRVQVTLFPKRERKNEVQQLPEIEPVEYIEPESEAQNTRPKPDDWLKS